MAATNNKLKKDQIYPSDTFHTAMVFDTDDAIPTAATVNGSKVASLVNAINAKVQEQSSTRREKSNPVIKRTSSIGRIAAHSTEVGIGVRINSSDCLLSNRSHSQTLKLHSKYKLPNGFGSDCSDDDFDGMPTISRMMTRSLGRNEFLSKKAMHSPSRTFLREIPKGKVESNPFFQQDRQRTDVKQLRSSIKPMEDSNAFTLKCCAVSNSEGLSEPLSIKMRIQLWSEKERAVKQHQVLRRKSAHFPVSSSLTKELDSVLPSHDVCLSGSVSASHGISTRQRSNSMSSLRFETQTEIEDVPTIVSVSVASAGSIDTTGISSKVEALSPEGNVDIEAIMVDKKGSSPHSSPQTSPLVSPKGSPKRSHRDFSLDAPKSNLHKLSSKLLSPHLRRKKRDSSSQDCEEKNVKIASRSSRKRKAFKSKFHTTLSNPTYAEIHKPSAGDSISNIDDDVFAVEDDTNLQTCVNTKGLEMVITKNGTESLPVNPQQIFHSINSCKLTQTATIETGNMKSTKANPEQEDDRADSITMSCSHSEHGRQQHEVKRTISGDIREIINSFGSASDSEMNMCRMSSHYGSGESSSDGKLHLNCVGSCMFYIRQV